MNLPISGRDAEDQAGLDQNRRETMQDFTGRPRLHWMQIDCKKLKKASFWQQHWQITLVGLFYLYILVHFIVWALKGFPL